MKLRWPGAAAALVATLLLGGPIGRAHATFHEMSIREVYPGSSTEPTTDYVELQMWAPGQNFVGGHVLRTYSAIGATTETVLASDVPSGANQSTIVIATPAAAEHFGIVADEALSGPAQLDPAGGAVCWEALDCVSWGSFAGKLPSPAGTPAAAGGIPDGMALRRTIAPGCPTLLEPTDDRDNSAADLAAVSPAPRPNSVVPSEHACSGGGGGLEGSGGGSHGGGAPQTILRHKPPRRTADRTPTFRFAADEAGVSFQCKVDRGAYRRCRSPFTTARLSPGHHTFAVRARDDSSKVDPTPARYGFRVIVKP